MKALLLCGAALGVSLSAAAEAQTAAPLRDSMAGQRAEDIIIVTAQRREENVQEVPIAVSVFTDVTRDRLGIRTIQDMTNVAPGVTFDSQLDRLSVRGVGRLTNTIGSDPGVAVYNDGFYTSSNAEASKTPMFVQSVQILRGPQGTLFGRNSVGGAINVISKRPQDVFGGEVRLSGDRYNGVITEGFLTGPIAEGLTFRASVQFGPRPIDEAFRNVGPAGDQGSTKRFLVEGQLQYKVGDVFDLWLKYSHGEWDHERYGLTNLVTPYATAEFYPAGALVPNSGYGYATPNPGVADPRLINTNTTNEDTLSKNHNFVANMRLALSDDVQLKYVGGYSQYVYTLFTDIDRTAAGTRVETLGSKYGAYSYDPTYIQRYIEDKKYYSNEVTLSNSDSNDRFNWVIGAYQYHEHFYQPVDWFQGGDGTDSMAVALASPLCVDAAFANQASCAANPLRSYYSGTGDLKIDSYAGFAQVDFRVTDALKITAGLRYSSDHKVGTETYRLVSYNPAGSAYCVYDPYGVIDFGGCGPLTAATDITTYVLQLPGSGPQTRTMKRTFNGWSWRLGADYQLSDRAMIYVSYNRGLKAGGFNLGSYAAQPLVENERVDAYEAGIKSQPLPRTTLNVTGFYYDYRNAQIPIAIPLAPALGLNTTNFFNIDKTRAKGLEVETTWNVTDQFELTGSYSWLDSKIRKAPRLFDDPNQPGTLLIDLAGKRSPTTSKHKFYIGGLYDLPVGRAHVMFALSYAYRSDAYYDVFNSATARAPGWDQVDTRITYVDPSGRLTLIGYVRNIFDSLGYVGASGNPGTGATGFGQLLSFTPPRQIGAELQFKF